MNLYEIDDAIMHCFDEETGEIFEAEYLDQLEMLRDQKIENIACWIKNLRSDAEQLKLETDKLTDRRKHTENKAESLKTYLQRYLSGEKFKTAKAAISYRNTESVDVPDASLLPEEFQKIAVTADKTAIKAAIKAGAEVAGASLQKNVSMIIK